MNVSRGGTYCCCEVCVPGMCVRSTVRPSPEQYSTSVGHLLISSLRSSEVQYERTPYEVQYRNVVGVTESAPPPLLSGLC
jgi:hypothetical protein